MTLLAAACTRTTSVDPPTPSRVDASPIAREPIAPAVSAVPYASASMAAADASPAATSHAPVDGPHDIALAPGRPIYYARAAGNSEAAPLVAVLHGQCGPPAYACGTWLHAAVDVGMLVCPTGNSRCGDSGIGPPSWEGPTWKELVTMMDDDLEASIAKVQAKHPNGLRRDVSVLTGYSRGGFAVPILAARHPKRWPYLIMIEADATLTPEGLRRAGVLAVALVAGELGDQIAGMRKSADDLTAAGFPARLFVMPKTGHLYSSNMEDVMQAALAFVLASKGNSK